MQPTKFTQKRNLLKDIHKNWRDPESQAGGLCSLTQGPNDPQHCSRQRPAQSSGWHRAEPRTPLQIQPLSGSSVSALEPRYSHSHLSVNGFCMVPHSWSYSRIHIPRRCFQWAEPTSRDRALPGKNDGRVSIWLLSWGNADHLGGNNPNIGSTLKGSGWLFKKGGVLLSIQEVSGLLGAWGGI